MGDLYGAFQKVSPQNKNNSFDQIAAYEEYYMKLLKRYQGDIQNIEEMMENLRKERKDFYLKELAVDFKRLNQNTDDLMRMGMQNVNKYLEPMAKSLQIDSKIDQQDLKQLPDSSIVEGEALEV